MLDDETAIVYSFTGLINANILKLKLDLTATLGQIINLELTRDSATTTIQKTSSKDSSSKLNANIFGLWRHTSVYSSGTGDYHFSMSTDYFLDLRADGTFTRWTGKSGGHTQETSVITDTDTDEEKVIGTWYCQDKMLYTQPNGGQLGFFKYYAENNQMMLTTRYGDKSVYDRIR